MENTIINHWMDTTCWDITRTDTGVYATGNKACSEQITNTISHLVICYSTSESPAVSTMPTRGMTTDVQMKQVTPGHIALIMDKIYFMRP